MELEILRGCDKIGENLIEVRGEGVRVLIECGTALEPSEQGERIERAILKNHYDATVITHLHPDHAGLLRTPLNADKIYMGEATYRILCHLGAIYKENTHRVRVFYSEEPFLVGDIEIIPHLCDHSAYDSYMIEIRHKDKVALYTGDFRFSGRKGQGRLLSRLPREVDLLICEGTRGESYCSKSEYDLEREALKIMKNHKRVFFMASATNADRIVTLYKATLRSGGIFLLDDRCGEICELCKGIPTPNYSHCHAFFTHKVDRKRHERARARYSLVGKAQIAKMERFTMRVGSYMLDYLRSLNDLSSLRGSVLIYSMWQGYKQSEQMSAFLYGVREMGIEVVDLHISGHADKGAIERLIDTLRPKRTIFVHREIK